MIRRTTLFRTALTALTGLIGLGSSGCGFTGINDRPLPFSAGNGPGSMTVTVQMANAVNLVPNSEVKVGDVTVGSVRRIEFSNWHAKLTVGLNRGTVLPANAVARIGQKSLLGAEYLELTAPPDGQASGRLANGAVIPLGRSGRYPETEEVLSALSLVLNGGGLQQIQTINRELNTMLAGREGDARALLKNLDTFVGRLNAQRHDLVRALDGLQRLSGTLADQRETIETALDTIPPGLRTLNAERAQLVRTLEALADFGVVADRVLKGSQTQLTANLRNLRPVLRELADAGRALPESVGYLTFPFPIDSIRRSFKGDYINLFATLDLTLPTLDRNFLTGTPLAGILGGQRGALPSGPGTQGGDPLRLPLQPPTASPTKPKPSPGPGQDGPGGEPSPAPTGGRPTSPDWGPLGDLLNPTRRGGG